MAKYDAEQRAIKVFEADLDDPATLGARAIEALARSWRLEERECQALALADAQVWATLRLAAQTGRLVDATAEHEINLVNALRELTGAVARVADKVEGP
jgi:hypothetical protein